MPREKINCKDILRLHDANFSQDRITAVIHASKKSVSNVIKRARDSGIRYQDICNDTNDSIHEKLFPEQYRTEKPCYPDMEALHRNIAVPGKTLSSEYDIFCGKCVNPVGYSTMCLAYDAYLRENALPSHVVYKYGAVIQCSWLPQGLEILDMTSQAFAFIGVLPASGHVFVELTEAKDEDTFIRCVGHMLFSVEGAARCIEVLHARQKGSKRLKTGEFTVGNNILGLGSYYGVSVRFDAQGDYLDNLSGRLANLLGNTGNPLSLQEIIKRVSCWSSAWNKTSASAFMEEKEYLITLPAAAYDVVSKHNTPLTVQKNSHVKYHGNYYSAPYELRGKKVRIQYTDTMIELLLGDVVVAVHDRFASFATHQYATDGEHMPPLNRQPFANKRRMLAWSRAMGPYVGEVAEKMFARVQYEEQAYNSVHSLLQLGRTYTRDRLNDVCGKALAEKKNPGYKYISDMIKHR